ncbi:MAG: glycosyltransferase [Myxococcota bacterium]
MWLWPISTAAVYLCLLGVLSVFAVHRFFLALAVRRQAVADVTPPIEWPSVLVQLPLYNERNVAQRVVDAVCALDYPHGRLSIQVLDDSTDGTSQLVGKRVRFWADRGCAIVHMRRRHRAGFKAGALGAGLRRSNAALVAIFDADFVPAADFLRRLVPHFGDDRVGMVQARWGHLNRYQDAFTHAQSILLDGHFANEHGGRQARGCYFNFNGTAGIWRRACIDDAGGWSGRTLTEDLDLSYRAQLRGWRFVYCSDVQVDAELPATVEAFKLQQHRWAKGSVETAKILLPQIWRSPIGLKRKRDATFHLLGNLAYPFVLLLALLMPVAMSLRLEEPSPVSWVIDLVLLSMSTCTLIWFYGVALIRVGADWRCLWRIPFALAIGAGLAVNNSRGLMEALLGRTSEFCRTPKVGRGAFHTDRGPIRKGALGQALLELGVGTSVVLAVWLALIGGRPLAVPFLALFASGFLFLGGSTVWAAACYHRDARREGKTLTAPLT